MAVGPKARRANDVRSGREQTPAPTPATSSCAATEQARDDAAAIVLLAKARIGELTREMPKAKAGRAGGPNPVVPSGNKTSALAAEGLSRKDAADQFDSPIKA
jgi:hypothetical protein